MKYHRKENLPRVLPSSIAGQEDKGGMKVDVATQAWKQWPPARGYAREHIVNRNLHKGTTGGRALSSRFELGAYR